MTEAGCEPGSCRCRSKYCMAAKAVFLQRGYDNKKTIIHYLRNAGDEQIRTFSRHVETGQAQWLRCANIQAVNSRPLDRQKRMREKQT